MAPSAASSSISTSRWPCRWCRRGLTVESVQAAGRRITYALDGAVVTAGEVVRRLTEVAALRDISILEPDIEDVVARLYTRGQAPGPPQGWCGGTPERGTISPRH